MNESKRANTHNCVSISEICNIVHISSHTNILKQCLSIDALHVCEKSAKYREARSNPSAITGWLLRESWKERFPARKTFRKTRSRILQLLENPSMYPMSEGEYRTGLRTLRLTELQIRSSTVEVRNGAPKSIHFFSRNQNYRNFDEFWRRRYKSKLMLDFGNKQERILNWIALKFMYTDKTNLILTNRALKHEEFDVT